MKPLLLTQEFLNTSIDNEARGLVGKLLKRVEILKIEEGKKSLLRSLFRELIYEASRNLKWSLKSYSEGYTEQEKTEFDKEPSQDES